MIMNQNGQKAISQQATGLINICPCGPSEAEKSKWTNDISPSLEYEPTGHY